MSARVLDALAGGTPALAERRLLAQLLVPPPELRHALQVGRDVRIGELVLDFRERLLDLRDQVFHLGGRVGERPGQTRRSSHRLRS